MFLYQANILVDSCTETVKICDFGFSGYCASIVNQEDTQSGGTNFYAAPELFRPNSTVVFLFSGPQHFGYFLKVGILAQHTPK
jgi:serine/threonine protein kinase